MKQFLYGLLLTSTIISCSRDEDTTIIPPKQEDNIPLLPIQDGDIKYTYTDTDKLATINTGHGSIYIFKYDGDLIKSIKKESSNEEFIFEYDNQQRLVRAYNPNGNDETQYIYGAGILSERTITSVDASGKLIKHITQLSYSIKDGDIVSANGYGWDYEDSVGQRYHHDVNIWFGYDNKDNFAKNIKGLDKINIFLINFSIHGHLRLFGSKKNVIDYSWIGNGFSFRNKNIPIENIRYSYHSKGYMREYIYNEKNIAVGFKEFHTKTKVHNNEKYERGEIINKDYIIKYNKQP